MDLDREPQPGRIPFYERIAAGMYNRVDLQLPSNHEIGDNDIHDISTFENGLPTPEKPQRLSLIRPHIINSEIGDSNDIERVSSETHIQSIFIPTLIICIPIALLTAALLALVLAFRVVPRSNLFMSTETPGPGYILVNFSASMSLSPSLVCREGYRKANIKQHA